MNKQITEIKPGMKIINKNNPEWGTWKIERLYTGTMWEVFQPRGGICISEYEIKKFWELA